MASAVVALEPGAEHAARRRRSRTAAAGFMAAWQPDRGRQKAGDASQTPKDGAGLDGEKPLERLAMAGKLTPEAHNEGRGMTGKKKRVGRPSLYSKELAELICERILERNKDGNPRSLRDVCKDNDMPSEKTVYKWLTAEVEFAKMYTGAREMRANMVADDTLEIADTEPDPQKARVRIDARKWWAAKTSPKKYGDKIQQEISGGDRLSEILKAIDGDTRGIPTPNGPSLNNKTRGIPAQRAKAE